MRNNINFKGKNIYFLTGIIILQILVIWHMAGLKTNYFIDELYSFGYARNFALVGDTARYITTSSDFRFNEWISNSSLISQITLSEGERFTHTPTFDLIQKFINERNYFGLLNIAESLFGNNVISHVPGVILNLIFFIISEIAMFSLLKKLHVNTQIGYLAIAMFGFSAYIISSVLYIRFYMCVIMLFIMMVNVAYRLWNLSSWKGIIKWQTILLLIVYFSYKNSELTMIFFGAFMSSFFVALWATKKWKILFSCIISCILGVIYVAVSSDYIGMLLNPQNYSNASSVAVGASKNIAASSAVTLSAFMMWVLKLFSTHYLGSYWLLYFLAAAVTVCLIITSEGTEQTQVPFSWREIRRETFFSAIIWFLLLLVSWKIGHGIYFCLAVLCFVFVWGARQAMGYSNSVKDWKLSSDTTFILVLSWAAIVYTLFEALCKHNIWRYYCFGFVSIAIVTWYLVDRLIRRKVFEQSKNSLIILLSIFVIANIFITMRSNNIEYIYREDRKFIDIVKKYSDYDVVMFLKRNGYSVVSREELYDCVHIMPPTASMYMIDMDKYDYTETDYPDKFLLWSHKTRNLTDVTNELAERGFEIKELGSDHCSVAYLCLRN